MPLPWALRFLAAHRTAPSTPSMSQATASASASAFRKKPVTFAPARWSGRLALSERSRPGGLLIAALQQCADEQALSLSELASALGVSYWSLSQLRIGFRPIDALDADMAEACAAFLDLPELTIRMLAGLLEPGVALAEHPVTPEDILHARRLLDCAPEDLELVPPPSRARPLQGLTVDELAELQRSYGDNPALCDALREELAQRPRSKTELLRAALGSLPEAAEQREDAAPGPVILRCTGCQTRLRVPHLSGPGEIRCPSCQAEYAVHWQASTCLVQKIEAPSQGASQADGPEASVAPAQDPWAVLGLPPGSDWEAVERARRSLLQQYHPDRLGHVSPLVRRLAEDAFKRVSDAYEAVRPVP